MKKKLATTLLAGAMSASMVIPAFATGTTTSGVVPADTGTEVWAGVIIQDQNPIVKVEVPTLFAFVVNGTVDSNKANEIVTSSNGNIYLPNVKVEVDQTAASPNNQRDYSLTYTGDGVMRMNNYSTFEEEDSANSTTVRKGLALTINGEIRESSTVAADKNYWIYATSVTPGDRADFKKYQITIDNIAMTKATSDGYKMASDIALSAPDTEPTLSGSTWSYGNLNTTSNLAVNPTTHVAAFDVIVGGERGQYSQVEQSAKIGTIVWTVSAAASTSDYVETAPDNEYLAIDPSTGTDPDTGYVTTPGGN